MTVHPAAGGAPISEEGSGHSHSGLARVAVWIAEVGAGVLGVGYAIFFVALALGGWDAVSDTWVGLLGTVALYVGLLASLAAFALAIVARVRHETWALLRLPLYMFPALVVLVVLVEAFWME